MSDKAHEMSRSKGWYDGENAVRNVPEMLALIHSEVSEALEEYRVSDSLADTSIRDEKGKPVGFASEIADVVIRIGDLCGYLGIDLESAVEAKMAFNATRPHRHGGKKA
jgi:NTP pyrophosphatase (non-canonical NTP hydrolase)